MIHQVIFGRHGAFFAELHIVFFRADDIGVALDLEHDIGVFLHYIRDFSKCGYKLGFYVVFVEIKFHVFYYPTALVIYRGTRGCIRALIDIISDAVAVAVSDKYDSLFRFSNNLGQEDSAATGSYQRAQETTTLNGYFVAGYEYGDADDGQHDHRRAGAAAPRPGRPEQAAADRAVRGPGGRGRIAGQ